MIDITSIKKYIIKLTIPTVSFIENEIKEIGLNTYLEYNLNRLDCTKILSCGLKAIQTIDYTYRRILTEIVYTIDNYIEDSDKDNWYIRLLKLHEANIEYEKLNPPIIYGGIKNKRNTNKKENIIKSKSSNKRNKNVDTESNIEKKMTAAEKKLALKAVKLNSLTFKIKPIK